MVISSLSLKRCTDFRPFLHTPKAESLAPGDENLQYWNQCEYKAAGFLLAGFIGCLEKVKTSKKRIKGKAEAVILSTRTLGARNSVRT